MGTQAKQHQQTATQTQQQNCLALGDHIVSLAQKRAGELPYMPVCGHVEGCEDPSILYSISANQFDHYQPKTP